MFNNIATLTLQCGLRLKGLALAEKSKPKNLVGLTHLPVENLQNSPFTSI